MMAKRQRTPEEMEAEAGRLLVEAYKARLSRGDLGDVHEMRHIYAALTTGNTEDCDPAHCKLDQRESA